MDDTLRIVSWINVFLTLFLAITCIICTVKYYTLKNKDFISSRQPNATILSCSLLVLFLICERILVLLWFQLNCSKISYYKPLLEFTYLLFGVGAIYCILYRAYVIWYEINCQLALQDKNWRELINKSEQNWFLNQKIKENTEIFGS